MKIVRMSLASLAILLVAVPAADAKTPSTSSVERAVPKSPAGRRVFAAYADCFKTGSKRWSCDVTTASDIGRGASPSYHCTATYSGGKIRVGRMIRS